MNTETDSATFADRLRTARAKAGLTQAQLGLGMGKDDSDLGKGAVSSWEVGASTPSSSQLALICRRLGVSADYLLGTDAPPAANDTAPTEKAA
jgi:transcriptional regulator with XRE-family HTH domain